MSKSTKIAVALRPSAIRMAEFRFSVIGELLSSPPEHGDLSAALRKLAAKYWVDPITGEKIQLTIPTIERWYYKARKQRSPIDALKNKSRLDLGSSRSMNQLLLHEWHKLYADHSHWSLLLLYDNFQAWAQMQNPPLTNIPSYSTMRRLCLQNGWIRRRQPRRREDGSKLPSSVAAEMRKANTEIRSYEAEFVGGLWHLDFHKGSRAIALENGEWVRPVLLGVLDDSSRLICHAQWYLAESAENLIHGYCQALQKRGMPRAQMTDNGAAMISDEFKSGLSRLSILHELTLEYSPHQNGKQEKFWTLIEGRLLPMIENVKPLTLHLLNDLTQIWLEGEYNNKLHSEINETPVHRFSHRRNVLRECPSTETLRRAFVSEAKRRQRKSDGTVSLNGVRFEIPSAYRHHSEIWMHYKDWDLSNAYLVDPRTREPVAVLMPLDKVKNSSSKRQPHTPAAPLRAPYDRAHIFKQLSPQMQKLMKERLNAHLPPAFTPKNS